MNIAGNFDGTFSLNGMNIDDLKMLKNIIRSSCLVDKRNFYNVEKEIDQFLNK